MKDRVKTFVSTNPIEVAIGICLVIAALAVGSYVGSWGKQTEIDEYKEQVEQFEQRVTEVTQFSDSLKLEQDVLNEQLDSLHQERTQIQQEADRYRRSNIRLQTRIDSLRTRIQDIDLDSIPVEVVDYISALEIQVDTLKAEITVLRSDLSVYVSELTVWQDKFNLEQQRADSLQAVITTFPTNVPDPDRILFGLIKLPSRTTSFLVGGAMGVIGGITFAQAF